MFSLDRSILLCILYYKLNYTILANFFQNRIIHSFNTYQNGKEPINQLTISNRCLHKTLEINIFM